MSVLGVITARGGSKRVPRKNIRLLGGKPLVCWVIEAALSAQHLDTIVVSSEDRGILELAESYRPGLGLFRPPELATDTAPSIWAVEHALKEIERNRPVFDFVAVLQPANPFVSAEDIDGTIGLLATSGADSCVSITPARHIHPAKLKTIDENNRLTDYLEDEAGRMDSRVLPPVYIRNGSVYASRRHVIVDGRIIGSDCRGYVVPPERSVDIDDPLDWEFAEFLAERMLRVR